MPVRVVESPYERLRCVCCSQRVGDTVSPFFDFGAFDDGPVELLQGDPLGKVQHHDDVLVCAACLRKAAERLPGVGDLRERLEGQVAEAREGERQAREVARALAQDVAAKLAPVVSEPVAIEPVAIEQVDTFKVPVHVDPDLAGMTTKELRAFARDNGITIGAGVTKQDEIRSRIEDALQERGQQ